MAEPLGARYLTDEDAVEDLLLAAAEAAQVELRGTRLRSIHTRAGRSRSHVFEATLADSGVVQEVLLIAHADRKRAPVPAFELEQDGARVAVWRFPNDPYLPGLPSAVDPQRVRELLDRLGGPPGRVALHTRAYRPSRRAVVEVTVTSDDLVGRILYLKVLAGDRAEELAGIHRELATRVPVPRVVGVAPDQGILALEALEGETLRAVLVDGGRLPDPSSIVDLSCRLAGHEVDTGRAPRAFADPSRHVEPLCTLAPELEQDIRRVAMAASQLDGDGVGVHGDLHDGQLLLQNGEVTGVLDVDGAGPGLLAHDVGNLVAHVEVVGHLWPQVASRCSDYAAALRAAYLPLVGAAELAVASAGAWLGLATGPHRAQEEGWPAATRRRIERAARCLDDGS